MTTLIPLWTSDAVLDCRKSLKCIPNNMTFVLLLCILLFFFFFQHANAYLDSSFSCLDVVSTGFQLAVFLSSLYSCLHWSDAEWNERCPYISRHSFPVVEARDWLSSCLLERVDWLRRARWPSLICTRQVKATSHLWPTAPTLIGRLSSALSSTHWSKSTPLQTTEEGCVSTFCSCKMMAYLQMSLHLTKNKIHNNSLFLKMVHLKRGSSFIHSSEVSCDYLWLNIGSNMCKPWGKW